jgi:hypothetical protein
MSSDATPAGAAGTSKQDGRTLGHKVKERALDELKRFWLMAPHRAAPNRGASSGPLPVPQHPHPPAKRVRSSTQARTRFAGGHWAFPAHTEVSLRMSANFI